MSHRGHPLEGVAEEGAGKALREAWLASTASIRSSATGLIKGAHPENE